MTHPDAKAPEQHHGLPPFSGDETECAMCSNLEAFTVFRPACSHVIEEYNGRLERRGPLPQRLERRCQRCDYQWDEALNPAPGVRPATAQEVAYALEQSHAGWALDLSPECAQYMADRLAEMLHLLVRLDHPMWLPRPGRPLLVAPPAATEDSTGLTSGVPIFLPDQSQPPVGATGYTRAVES
ncbi:hypothetical protein [Streptomyces sp. A1136]|uniref:hypothetical protein n=1 Tax=Streptomyces sp. A1136 TaxID=2563102 RepID=UPI00109E5C4A|nr:hypothetical protein [Streptomyces sp. A1136]THA54283.1 hypothetical protein E6R62_17130 [Streptomyces sp. A1136]